MKVNESIKTIFYLPPYESLLKQGNFKTDHAQFLKLCLLKRVILLKKQHQRTFLHSYICKKMSIQTISMSHNMHPCHTK